MTDKLVSSPSDNEVGHPVLSIVTPLFNEQDTVPELVRRVVEACRPLGVSFEFIAVNDGSRDETLPRLITLSRNVRELRVVNLFRNFGHMAALSAGLALARGDAVIVMDGDLQDPPELIPRMVAEWRAGADVVYGLRTARQEGFVKRTAASAFHRIFGLLSETPVPTHVGTFGLMDRRVADILVQMRARRRYLGGGGAWVGGRQASVPYERPDRAYGRGRVGLIGLLRLARTALISFSKVPLRCASLFSLFCGFILFIIGTVAILVRLFSNLAIPGWATYTTLLGMIGFAQSVVLAIIAEYVAVIFDEIKARPLFLVREEYAHGQLVKAGQTARKGPTDVGSRLEARA